MPCHGGGGTGGRGGAGARSACAVLLFWVHRGHNSSSYRHPHVQFGNPHSRTHMYGWESENAVEKARAQVAALIGADPKEIIFTSGATESNNLALKGVAGFYKDKKRHIVTTQTEHKCVLDSAR